MRSEEILEYCAENGSKLAVAESLTGGLLAASFVSVPGASEVFELGVVTYSAKQKRRVLGVREETIEVSGVVSAETAREMAEGVARLAGVDVAISTTGVAGPDSLEGHEAGTLFVGAYVYGVNISREFLIKGDRAEVREGAVEAALSLVKDYFEETKE